MADDNKPLLIKRYASRRLYNTETSDYVTLDDIAGFIRAGREVQIMDLKSGDDLTRQYLLQIIAEHESRGENMLPVNVLTDLVRSYATQAGSVVPQFLQASFDMLRDSQSEMMRKMTQMTPMAKVPGFEAMQAQQEAFMKAMTAGFVKTRPGQADADTNAGSGSGSGATAPDPAGQDAKPEDLDEIKRQLAELQARLSKISK